VKTELNADFEENYEIKLKKTKIVGITANHKLVTMWYDSNKPQTNMLTRMPTSFILKRDGENFRIR